MKIFFYIESLKRETNMFPNLFSSGIEKDSLHKLLFIGDGNDWRSMLNIEKRAHDDNIFLWMMGTKLYQHVDEKTRLFWQRLNDKGEVGDYVNEHFEELLGFLKKVLKVVKGTELYLYVHFSNNDKAICKAAADGLQVHLMAFKNDDNFKEIIVIPCSTKNTDPLLVDANLFLNIKDEIELSEKYRELTDKVLKVRSENARQAKIYELPSSPKHKDTT